MKLKPATEFTYKGRKIAIFSGIYNCNRDGSLNPLQQQHIQGSLDVYQPILAHSERWVTKTKKNGYWEDYESASPIPNTQRRNDLPPVYMQWKEDYKKRYVRILHKGMGASGAS